MTGTGNDFNGNKNKSEYICHIDVTLDFNFFQSTWLQGTIESNTRSELLGVYDLWCSYAQTSISWAREYSQDMHFWRNEKKVTFTLFGDNSEGSGDSELMSNAAEEIK